ncbi:MEDS domain-containing protein [Actinoplanes sp. NPDC048796]|uniref:MEDS domain-containing protein n=1 Tax=unclassified Actinoplanes TaxID=2626549 RepID=UPI0033C0FBA9
MTAVDRLEPGDHACLTFSETEERLDLLAAFVTAGIQRGERIVCFTDALSVDELHRDLRRRGVPAEEEIRPARDLWASGASPDASIMVRRLAAERDQSPRGLRVTLDMCWAARPQAGAEQLLVFENEVSKLFADGGITAICEYDREAFDSVTLAYAVRTHPRTVTATVYHEDATLRICRQHVPPGVRVAGELGISGAGALRDALAEAVRLDADVHLNLGHLLSLDDDAAAVIVRAASGLPRNRHMIVVSDHRTGRALRLAGAHGVPNLRLLEKSL